METTINGITFTTQASGGYVYANDGSGSFQVFEPRKGDGAASAVSAYSEKELTRKARRMVKRWN